MNAEIFRSFAARSGSHAPYRRSARRDRAARNASHRADRRRKSRHASIAPGLYDRFAPHIFSAVQVQPRQAGARSVSVCRRADADVSPARCLVIEDSVAGIAGAVAAGMTVLGFHGGSHCRPGYGDSLRAAGAAADVRRYAAIAGADCADRGCRERELVFRCHSGMVRRTRPGISRFRVRCWRIAPE